MMECLTKLCIGENIWGRKPVSPFTTVALCVLMRRESYVVCVFFRTVSSLDVDAALGLEEEAGKHLRRVLALPQGDGLSVTSLSQLFFASFWRRCPGPARLDLHRRGEQSW